LDKKSPFFNCHLKEIFPFIVMKAVLINNEVKYFETIDEIFTSSEIDKIQYLELDNMNFLSLPDEISKLSSLICLSINHNEINTLPKLPNSLKILYINFNNFKTIPEEIIELPNLEILLMYSNKITTIPLTINKLKSLKTLGLSYNIISHLPKEIGELKNLKHLELKENNISTLPKTLVDMTNLLNLSLSNNKLNRLPKKMDKLNFLEKLDLDNNNLCFLTKEVFNLPNLIGISINFNKLHNLPKSFKTSKIKYLCCIYNNLQDTYDDKRLILNAKDLSKVDSILTIHKINKSIVKNQFKNNLFNLIKKTMEINI
jgi:Leucine-rich repeat (LRR) protein